MLIDGTLPAKEFLNCKSVFLARFFQAQQTTANGGNNFGFASDHPPASILGWKICNCQRGPIGADDIFYSRTYLIGHCTLTLNLTSSGIENRAMPLKKT
jgi:hypothetical protein